MSYPSPATRDTGRPRLTEEQAEQYGCVECFDEQVYRTSRYDCRTRRCTTVMHPCPECAPDCRRCGSEHSVLYTREDDIHCQDCGAPVCSDCGEAPAFVVAEEPYCFGCAHEEAA